MMTPRPRAGAGQEEEDRRADLRDLLVVKSSYVNVFLLIIYKLTTSLNGHESVVLDWVGVPKYQVRSQYC